MLDIHAKDLPAAMFRAHERIRELEREVTALQRQVQVREEQTQEAFAELARFRQAFGNAWQALRVMRNRARDAYQQCVERLSELLGLDALRHRVSELEQELQAERAARQKVEEELGVRTELHEFLTEQLESQRERIGALESALEGAGFRARITQRPRPRDVHAFLVD